MSPPSTLAFLATYLRPQGARFLALTGLLLGNIGLQLAGPVIIQQFIDDATHAATSQTLINLGGLYLGVAIVTLVIGAAATYVGQDVGWRATNHLRADLARHALGLDMAFHHLRTPGEFIERIDGDLTALSNFFSVFVINILGSVLLLIGAMALLFHEEWHAGLALTLFAAVSLGVLLMLRRFAVPAGIREREVSAKFLGFLEERLAGIDDIRANGGGHYMLRRFYEILRPWYQRGVGVWMRRSFIWSITTLLFTLGTVIMLGIAATFYLLHTISLGTAYLIFQYTIMLQRPMDLITQQFQELQRSLSSIARAREMFGFQATITSGTAVLAHQAGAALTFDDVTFAYQSDEAPIVHDLSFSLAPGEVLGLLGRTGSGKTTISRLIFRLYDVSHGTIRLDGHDLRGWDLATLRRRVGLVTQEVQLFHASVRENLTFFDATIADERIHTAIATLGLGDWFARLPQGLETELGASGGGLSAGEAQLLAFVRIFLRDPALVILDEPSSRLDPATEALIERGMTALLRGRTAIIIAHRLATVQRADTIMILDDGRIAEYGPRAQLAHDPASRFAALLRVGLEDAPHPLAVPTSTEVTA